MKPKSTDIAERTAANEAHIDHLRNQVGDIYTKIEELPKEIGKMVKDVLKDHEKHESEMHGGIKKIVKDLKADVDDIKNWRNRIMTISATLGAVAGIIGSVVKSFFTHN